MFTQPGCSPSFYEQVRVNKVSLENAYMEAPFVIGGVVRVLNLDFNKTVRVRWTVNDWHSHEDVLGTYVEGSSDVVTDKFSFKIQVGKLFIFNTELMRGNATERAILRMFYSSYSSISSPFRGL